MEQKAWIDVKSPRFFIWKAIQYIGVFVSGVKPLIPPTTMQISILKIPTMSDFYQNRPNLAPITVPVVR
jgi:hypothetical protein